MPLFRATCTDGRIQNRSQIYGLVLTEYSHVFVSMPRFQFDPFPSPGWMRDVRGSAHLSLTPYTPYIVVSRTGSYPTLYSVPRRFTSKYTQSKKLLCFFAHPHSKLCQANPSGGNRTHILLDLNQLRPSIRTTQNYIKMQYFRGLVNL